MTYKELQIALEKLTAKQLSYDVTVFDYESEEYHNAVHFDPAIVGRLSSKPTIDIEIVGK